MVGMVGVIAAFVLLICIEVERVNKKLDLQIQENKQLATEILALVAKLVDTMRDEKQTPDSEKGADR